MPVEAADAALTLAMSMGTGMGYGSGYGCGQMAQALLLATVAMAPIHFAAGGVIPLLLENHYQSILCCRSGGRKSVPRNSH